ncbi:PIR Superfamily Protein [Plasmodium ovale wallikeri]|nr:PIR Superfamily Protein [Plasmodium ovale wallikeri]SBT56252.1 PIR Superfamily Protein [Plasmodium ovale wallikeri]
MKDVLTIEQHADRCSYFIYLACDLLKKEYNSHSVYVFGESFSTKPSEILVTIGTKKLSNEYCYFPFDDGFDEWRDWKYLHDYF